MRQSNWAIGLMGAALTFSTVARADLEVVKNEKSDVTVGAMTQVVGSGQRLDDPYASKNRVYMYMPKARLRAAGDYDRVGFNFELGLGGEDKIISTTGVGLGLLDLSFHAKLDQAGRYYVNVGQFKVPYGREQLTYVGNTIFADRSVVQPGVVVGRDVGAAIVAKPGMFTLVGGIFTGGGRDVPVRQLPQKLGVPMVVARLGVGNASEDPLRLTQSARGVESLQWAVNVNGLYTKDSEVGHSSVLSVKFTDKSLLLNSNWNPYIGAKPFDPGVWYQAGGDAMVRAPIGGGWTAGGEAQFDYAKFENNAGSVELSGARVQGSVARGGFEGALRYAVLIPDEKFVSGTTQITGKDPIHEITPALSYSFFGQDNLKVVADLPVTLNAPVISETNVGSYVGTDMPDQTSVLAKGGSVSKQNIVTGRLMFQAQF